MSPFVKSPSLPPKDAARRVKKRGNLRTRKKKHRIKKGVDALFAGTIVPGAPG